MTKLPAPDRREAQAIAQAKQRRSEMRQPPMVGAGNLTSGLAPHSDASGWRDQLAETFGTSSTHFALVETTRLLAAFGPGMPEVEANAALAMIDGLRPTNEVEALLASQMYVTHAAAMHLMAKPTKSEFECNMAIKFMRTFTAQTEALAKLQRKGEQIVRVEHVHVHSGGQAVVGNVMHAPAGEGRANETTGQPYAPDDPRAVAFAYGSPLWGENPIGEAVPIAECLRENPMPNARRRKG